MPPPPRRPSPGFRLNAPQAESQAENGSGEFAGLGDEIEPVSAFSGNSASEKIEQSPQKSRTSLTLEEQRQILLQQQLAAAATHSVNPYATTTSQPQAYAPPPSSPFPYKCLIVLGIFIILLLLGLIVTVVLVLGGEKDSDANSSNGLVPTVPIAQPPSISPVMAPDMPTTPPTTVESSSNQSPTPFPSTTLGRIRQRGRLLCGVAEEQPGFSQLISDEQGEKRIGIDAELVSRL